MLNFKGKLPALEAIIYQIEDLSSENDFWLDIDRGQLRILEPEFLETAPELLGKVVFPLPPWSSEQGYDLMLEFAHSCQHHQASEEPNPANELLKILRSRHQVFMRYRKYLKLYPDVKRSWQSFKERCFCHYLRSWYSIEFPQATELLELLSQLGAGESPTTTWAGSSNGLLVDETKASLSESLLHEDFEFRETLGESAAQYQALSDAEKELRAFSLLQCIQTLPPLATGNPLLGHDARFLRLRNLCNSLDWLNRLESMSPTGECVACLYWTWQDHLLGSTDLPNSASSADVVDWPHRVRIVETLCKADYSGLTLENYLLHYFLYVIGPREQIVNAELYLSIDSQSCLAETLLGLKQKSIAQICQITLGTNTNNQGSL